MVNAKMPHPEKFDMVRTRPEIKEFLEAIDTNLCFFGNDCIQIVFYQDEKEINYTLETEVKLEKYKKILVNVGSVGQPRDDNPKSCFVIYDTEEQTVWIKRVAYDIEAAQDKIRKVGLPEFLAERLQYGR